MFQCKWSDRSSQEERAKFNAEISYLRSLKWISKADQSTLFSQKFVSRLNLQLSADFWTRGWNYDIPNESDFTSIDNLIFTNEIPYQSRQFHLLSTLELQFHKNIISNDICRIKRSYMTSKLSNSRHLCYLKILYQSHQFLLRNIIPSHFRSSVWQKKNSDDFLMKNHITSNFPNHETYSTRNRLIKRSIITESDYRGSQTRFHGGKAREGKPNWKEEAKGGKYRKKKGRGTP